MAVSIDGFISAPNHNVSSFPHDGTHAEEYAARLANYDTVLMGRHTYEVGYQYGLEPGDIAYPGKDHHVFSNSLLLPESSAVSVHTGGWLEVITGLKLKEGGPIYLCGGGQLAGFLANHDLIDLLRLKRAPVVFGSGTPIFSGLERELTLDLVAHKSHENGVLYSEYELAI